MSEEAKSEALEVQPAEPEAVEAEPPRLQSNEFFSPRLLATLRKVVPLAWLLAVAAAGIIWGIEVAFLVFAAGVLTLVITLFWSSVQSLTGGAPLGFEEALGMGAPSKAEEEKRAVLRALKDLEYERGVGKISPEDYAELLAKYRSEAKRLMQRLDEALGPAREQVELSLSQRLERAGEPQPEASEGAPADGEAQVMQADETPIDEAADAPTHQRSVASNLPRSVPEEKP